MVSHIHERLKRDFLANEGTKLVGGVPRRAIPASLMYYENGFERWRDVTSGPQFYQTRVEIELLEHYGAQIVELIEPGSLLIDLGSGEFRKVEPLLDALEAAQKDVQYIALDIAPVPVEEAISRFRKRYQHIQSTGLWGTFGDGIEWLKKFDFTGPKWFLSLGSIFCYSDLEESVTELTWLVTNAIGLQDRMLLGVDAETDRDVLWASYHDADGRFERFISNGLQTSNKLLGHNWYQPEDWEISSVFVDETNQEIGHAIVIRAKHDLTCDPLELKFSAGEEIRWISGNKKGPSTMRKIFTTAGFKELASWKTPSGKFYEYAIAREQDDDGQKGPAIEFPYRV